MTYDIGVLFDAIVDITMAVRGYDCECGIDKSDGSPIICLKCEIEHILESVPVERCGTCGGDGLVMPNRLTPESQPEQCQVCAGRGCVLHDVKEVKP